MKKTFSGFTLAFKSHHSMYLKTRDATKEYLYLKKNKTHFVVTLSHRTCFWDTAVPCGSAK